MTSFLNVITSQTTGTARAISSCIDSQGNIFVLGEFTNSITFNNKTLYSYGNEQSLFVVKVSSDLTTYYATIVIGSNNVFLQGSAIFIDSNDNVYVTSIYRGSALTIGNYILPATSSSSFIAKMDNNLTTFMAVDYITGNSSINFITGNNSNIYVIGTIYSAANFGSIPLNPINGPNTFIAKLDYNLNWLIVTQIGNLSSSQNDGTYLAIYGNTLYACGMLYSSIECMNGSSNPIILYNNIASNVYITTLDINSLQFTNAIAAQTNNQLTINSTRFEEPKVITDNNGNVYLTISYTGSLVFSNYKLTNNTTNYQGVVVSFTGNLIPTNILSVETNGSSNLTSIIASSTYLYVTGFFNTTIAITNNNNNVIYSITPNGSGSFIIKLNFNFNVVNVLTATGTVGITDQSINGNLYAVGIVSRTVNFGNIQIQSSGSNMFIANISP